MWLYAIFVMSLKIYSSERPQNIFAIDVRQHFPWNIVAYSYLVATYLTNS